LRIGWRTKAAPFRNPQSAIRNRETEDMADEMTPAGPTEGQKAPAHFLVVPLLLLLGVAGYLAWKSQRPVEDNPYRYPEEQIERARPQQIKWREAAEYPTGFAQVRGLAVTPDGRMLVSGDGEVRIFGPTGARAGDLQLAGEPQCSPVGPDGTLFVGLKDHVETFSAKLERLAAWPSLGPKARISGLAFQDGHVWVADSGAKQILKCDLNGQVVLRLGDVDVAHKEDAFVVYRSPLDVTAGLAGRIWASNPGRHRVECYNEDGARQEVWGRFSNEVDGFFSCCNPCAIAVLPDGRVVTAEKAFPRVKVYSAGGALDGFVADVDSFAEKTDHLDLAVDAAGRILVLDCVRKTIRVFEEVGATRKE
jgi:hypothetical protein